MLKTSFKFSLSPFYFNVPAKLIYLQLFFIFTCFDISAQNKIIFSSPLPIPLHLAGNFGEIRPNHFHSGIDIKTDNREGIPVMAAASGYVSRIKVSSVGFGKAIYITHSNGLVTVYGHLHTYNEAINNFVRTEQYKQKKFEVELFPDSNLFTITEGSIIGFSGNTGGSEGPHLHFEVRQQKTEFPVNPLSFPFQINDTIAPIIKNIYFYYFDTLNNQVADTALTIPVSTNDGKNYQLLFLPEVIGKTAIGFEGYDLAGNDSNKIGIYSAELFWNNNLVFSYQMDQFSFDETRYANAHIDYFQKKINDIVIERCFQLPGDYFSAYTKTTSGGIINTDSLPANNFRLVLKDKSGNQSVLQFDLAKPKTQIKQPVLLLNKNNFFVETDNKIKTPEFALSVPKGALYQNAYITFTKTPRIKKTYSPVYHIQKENTPLRLAAQVSIKPIAINPKYYSKALIAEVNDKNELSAVGGMYSKGLVTASIRTLKSFVVVLDTLSPKIEKPELKTDSILNKPFFEIKISDDFTGIKTYNGFVNGEWVVLEYDQKNKRLLYYPESLESIMNCEIKLEVMDNKENKATRRFLLSY